MDEKIKVLLVDDDIILGSEIADQLTNLGKYTVEYMNNAYGIPEAIEREQPDVLVFDVEIGNANGIDIVSQLYGGEIPKLPTIFISSNHSVEMKEKGLFAGGMNYLDKPFATRTLAAYIDRFMREQKKDSATPLDDHIKQLGNLQFDIRNRALICENRKIKDLRPMEFSILKELASNFNQFVPRADLMATAWGGEKEYYNDQSFNNYVRRLRKLLEGDTNLGIEMSRQFGYRLVVEGG